MADRKAPRTHWIHLRLNKGELSLIQQRRERSTSVSLSEYVRDVLFKGPVTIRYRNASTDDFLAQMIPLKNELVRVGVNLNQAVRKLHLAREIKEVKEWLTTHETAVLEALIKVEEIKSELVKIYRQWSPS